MPWLRGDGTCDVGSDAPPDLAACEAQRMRVLGAWLAADVIASEGGSIAIRFSRGLQEEVQRSTDRVGRHLCRSGSVASHRMCRLVVLPSGPAKRLSSSAWCFVSMSCWETPCADGVNRVAYTLDCAARRFREGRRALGACGGTAPAWSVSFLAELGFGRDSVPPGLLDATELDLAIPSRSRPAGGPHRLGNARSGCAVSTSAGGTWVRSPTLG